ncbi:MAG: hypothetical protein ACRBF0_10480 [Calditrichia bacterium]
MRLLFTASKATFSLLALLVFASSCASIGGSGVRKQLNDINTRLEKLDKQVANANKKIASMESDFGSTSKKVKTLESTLNANNEDAYLKVVVPILNIRTNPTTVNSNIIAKAKQGAYLRLISEVVGDSKWIQVEFLIDNYPYLGYVINNPEFVQEEVHDPLTFNRLYNRKLIRHMWETEIALELRSKKVKTVGVYVKAVESHRADRFLGHLAQKFRDHKIYIKPITSFDINKVSDICKKNKVQSMMSVEFEETNEDALPQLDIKLFDNNSLILYSALVPLQPMELPANLGRK